MKTMNMRKCFFTGTEVILVLAVLFGAGSGISGYMQKRKAKKLAQENVAQATEIKNLTIKVEELNKKKDEIVEQKDKTEKQLRTKASEGFSVLYEQASDIQKQTPTVFTEEHLTTAKNYVKVWGYQAMAQVIKWQQDAINRNIQETKLLMQKHEQLTKEYQDYKFKTSEEILKTKQEAIKHEEHAKSLNSKVTEFLDKNSWLNNLIFWGIVGGAVYLFISFGGFGIMLKSRMNAVTAANYYRRRKNAVAQAIKTFTEVNDDGNETMQRIIKSSAFELDDDDDDEHEHPIKALKRKLKQKKKS